MTATAVAAVPDRGLSQWDTRPDTANDLVRWAGIAPGSKVLEPSAGKGNIVSALLAAGADVTAIELDPGRAASLGSRFASVDVTCGDFVQLAADPYWRSQRAPFDVVVMNPPDTRGNGPNGMALSHVLAALSMTPRVIGLLRLAFLEGKERKARVWDRFHLTRLKVLSERERFEGDVVGTPKSPFAFFEIQYVGPSIMEWR